MRGLIHVCQGINRYLPLVLEMLDKIVVAE